LILRAPVSTYVLVEIAVTRIDETHTARSQPGCEAAFSREPMDNQDQICLFDGDSLSGYLDARQRAVARRRQHIQA